MRIKQAKTKTEIEEVRKLFREYEAFLDVDLCFQSFEKELVSLPGNYSRPSGDLFIGLDEGRTVGCVAVRKLSDDEASFRQTRGKREGLGQTTCSGDHSGCTRTRLLVNAARYP
jgi:putative acetyltransferase